MNLAHLIKRIEKKTEAKFANQLPYCSHRPSLITFPDGSIEGDFGECRFKNCDKPQLKISITYANCELQRKRMEIEARHCFDELRFADDIKLNIEDIIEIVCEEFDVSRETLLARQDEQITEAETNPSGDS